MKLRALEPVVPSRPINVVMPGKLLETLESYTRCFEASHAQPITPEAIIVEIVEAFIASDREFSKWLRGGRGKGARRSGKSPRAAASAADSQS